MLLSSIASLNAAPLANESQTSTQPRNSLFSIYGIMPSRIAVKAVAPAWGCSTTPKRLSLSLKAPRTLLSWVRFSSSTRMVTSSTPSWVLITLIREWWHRITTMIVLINSQGRRSEWQKQVARRHKQVFTTKTR